jgi:hypothetical protein
MKRPRRTAGMLQSDQGELNQEGLQPGQLRTPGLTDCCSNGSGEG